MSRNRSFDFSLNESSESVNEKIRQALKLTSSEKIDDVAKVRPKRKAATVSLKNPDTEDELDDSDADGHYKQPGDESSSEDDSHSSDNNNEVVAPAPAKKSRM